MHKKGIVNLSIAILLIVIVPIVVVREYKVLKPKKQTYQTPEVSVQEHHTYARSHQKEFVFIVFSQDGEPFSTQNMHSILEQKYGQYRIVFMNIGEDREPLRAAKIYIDEQNERKKVSFVQCSDLEAFYKDYSEIIYACRDDEVIVQMDGCDWLASDNILETLNEAYEDPDVWLTYGEYLEYPSYRKGRTKQVKSTKRVSIPWTVARLKTFYAGLFKQLHLQDDGSATPKDPSFLLPMVEMAKWHVRFIPDVLYIRSTTVHQEEAVSTREVSALPQTKSRQRADCIVLSEDNPNQLHHALHSVKEYLFDTAQVSVIFQSSAENHPLYRHLQEKHPRYRFREISSDGRDLKDVLGFSLSQALSKADHVLLVSDEVTLVDEVFSSQYINALENTKALVMFLSQVAGGANAIESVPCDRGMYARRLQDTREIAPRGVNLYRKETLRNHLSESRCKTITSLYRSLKNMDTGEAIALYLETSPLVSSNAR
jgi:hypothetical protein